MARKPAQTKPAAEDKTKAVTNTSETTATKATDAKTDAKPAAAATGNADTQTPAADTNNQATNTAASTTAAPANAPATDDLGQSGGKDGSVLPATNDDDDPEPDLKVICHRKGGCRRGKLRWSEGETRIVSADLGDYALAQLRGDPRFTVLPIGKD